MLSLVMKRNIVQIGATLLSILFILVSCGSPKRYAYMQDVEIAKQYVVAHDTKTQLTSGDRIAISVASSYPELVRPFNGEGFSSTIPGMQAAVQATQSNDGANETRELRNYGYQVDSAGEIDFPQLGKLRVAGLTLEQVQTQIEQRLIQSKMVPDARVNAILVNFQIYLLGALNLDNSLSNSSSLLSQGSAFSRLTGSTAGVLRIYDRERINILEALAYTGDLPINANIEKVNVIRREGDRFVTHRINMKQTNEIFNSPAFYLKQNDIIYVEPLYRKDEFESINRVMQVSSFIMTGITSVATLILLYSRL